MANVIEYKILGTDKLSGVAKKASASIGAIANATKVAAAAAASYATASFAMAAKVTEAQDRVQKFADRIGVAVEELTAYEYAAERSGIASAQFDMAVQRMTRRVAEAASGTGEAKDAIKQLGIDAASFNTLGLEDKLLTLADRLEGVESKSDRVRIAFKLFDSEGVSMLQMLDDGSEGMLALAADAEYLGVVVSEKAGRAAEAFQDQWTRVKSALTGVSYALAEDTIPVFTAAMEKVANFIADNRQNIVNFVNTSIRYFVAFGNVLGQIGNTFAEIFSGNAEVLSRFLDSIGEFVEAAAGMFMLVGDALLTGIVEGVKASTGVLNDFGAWLGKSLYHWVRGDESPYDLSEAMAQSMTQRISIAAERISARLEELKPALGMAGADLGNAILDGFGIDPTAALAQADATIAALKDGVVEQINSAKTEIAEATGGGLAVAGFDFKGAMEENALAFEQSLAERYQALAQSLMSEDELQRMHYENQLMLLEDAYVNGIIPTEQEYLAQRTALADEFHQTMAEGISGYVDTVSSAFSSAVTSGANMAKTIQNLGKQILSSIVQMLVKTGLQRMILASTNKSAVTSEATAEGSKAVGLAGANMFASMAAAPWPINLTAPAMAAAAQAGTAAIFASGKAIGAALGATVAGQADAGMTEVPYSGTYMLKGGERVVQPEQNRDLTEFLATAREGLGGTQINQLTININGVTDADSLMRLDAVDWRELVAGPILEAMNTLGRKGVKPEFA